jgi:RNA polymerase sigma factor (sigma-70 family)
VSIGSPLLRLRSDDQLVTLFREGNDEAFRVVHDRYRQRLFAYTRQMLPSSRQDAEDALQDVFVKAYSGLRATDRELALRAWLYRVAHNRCIDVLRRPVFTTTVDELPGRESSDPVAIAEQREKLATLIADVQRLPEQQRSALLMRELSGMSYNDLAAAMGLSVPAVKSLLVRARVSLAQALEARDAACAEIREELIDCHDRGVRATGTARRHLRDCEQCREFRRDVRGLSRQFAAAVPALGPLGLLAKLLGIGGGAGGSSAGAGGGAAAAGGGAAATGGVVAAVGGGSAAAGGGATLTAGHIATLVAAAIVTAGGAVALPGSVNPGASHAAHHRSIAARRSSRAAAPALVRSSTGDAVGLASGTAAGASASGTAVSQAGPGQLPVSTGGASTTAGGAKTVRHHSSSVSTGMAATMTLSAWGTTGNTGNTPSHAGSGSAASSAAGCAAAGTSVSTAEATNATSGTVATTGGAAGSTATADAGSGGEAGGVSGAAAGSGSRGSSCSGTTAPPAGSTGAGSSSTSSTAGTGGSATTSGDGGSSSTAATAPNDTSSTTGSTDTGADSSSGAASTPAG